jgi:hypothetical protein
MAHLPARVTIHMAASLDGFVDRHDETVDWLETSDEFPAGSTMEPEFVEAHPPQRSGTPSPPHQYTPSSAGQ